MLETHADRAIAIVGLACHYPGARSPKELWENILARRQEFRAFLEKRMPASDYHSPDPDVPDRTYGRLGAFLDGFAFDPLARKVPRSTAAATDITHWLALEVAAQCLADAGYAEGDGLPREKTGVLVGNSLTGEQTRANTLRLRWPYVRRKFLEAARAQGLSASAQQALEEELRLRYLEPFPPTTEDTLAGALSNTIAGRICGFFDFGGGGYVVDGACSSSLLAVCTAASALVEGRVDACLAGGVDVSMDPFELVGFAKARALTPTDMRVYDRRGNGFIPGEGCGFVLMKRLADARAAGNRVYAVLRGWGISSDGRNAITAPRVDGQARAIRAAWSGLGVPDFVEGHGTGTTLGDKVELEAIARAAGEGPSRRIGVTSLKSILGHTKAAAGIGAFLKAVISVNRRVMPPTAGCQDPNPVFQEQARALFPIRRGAVFPPDQALKAGASAMGFGGINTHVFLTSGDAPDPRLAPAVPETALLAHGQDAELFVLGADSLQSLRDQARALKVRADGISRGELVDLSAQLLKELPPRAPFRAALLADTPESLLARAEKLVGLEQADGPDVWIAKVNRPPRLGFLCPGQGSQALEAGRTLLQRDPTLATLAEGLARAAEEAGCPGLLSKLYPPLDQVLDDEERKALASVLSDTTVAQPAIALVSTVWAARLGQLGLTPQVTAGHSLGELTAFALAGAYDDEALVRLAALRGEAMAAPAERPAGMVSLFTDTEQARKLIAGLPGYAAISNINGPRQVVVAGERPTLACLLAAAHTAGIQARELPVSNGFHSELVADAAETLKRKVRLPVVPQQLRCRLYSSLEEEPICRECVLSDHVSAHVRAPVDFVSLLKRTAAGCDLLIELGPGRVLSGLAEGILPEGPRCLPVEGIPGKASDLLTVLAATWARGADIRWESLHTGRLVRPFVPASERRFIENPCEKGRESSPAPLPALEVPSPRPTPVQAPAALATGSLLTQLVSLIAERTGYDPGSISAQQRLQEDLNLDSIKAGEIIATVARRQGMADRVDPGQFLRYPLDQIAQAMEALSPPEASRGTTGQTSASSGRSTSEAGLAEQPIVSAETPRADRMSWSRAFGLRAIPQAAPLSPSWAGSTVNVLHDPGLAQALEARGALNSLEAEYVLASLTAPEVSGQVAQLRAAVDAIGPKTRGILFLQSTGGRFGLTAGGTSAPAAAFARSLSLERPGLSVRVLDVATGLPEELRLEAALSLRPEAPGFEGLGRDADGYWALDAYPLVPQAETVTPLQAGEVVLVTGGARGITAACAQALARRFGVRLALVGSTPPEALGDEVLKTLGRLALEGHVARYFCADLGNAGAVQGLIRAVREGLGPIAAVVHGAGRNTPRRVEQVSVEEALLELEPKLLGAEHMLQALSDAPPRLVVALTSIIGVSGMHGNAWYAFANEALDLTLARFAARNPGCTVRSLAYGVWSDIGMGARMGSVEGLSRMGIGALTPEEGVRRFLQVLTSPETGRQTILTAELEGLPTWPTRRRENRALAFTRGETFGVPGVSARVRLSLHPKTHPWLRDHRFNGTLLLPTVMGLEAMAQAAWLASGGSHFPLIEDIQLPSPVVVSEEGTQVEVRALVRESAPEWVDCEVRTELSGFARAHFSASFRLGDTLPRGEPRDFPPTVPPREPLVPSRDLYGGLLFQGPAFQRMGPLEGVGAGRVVFSSQVPDPKGEMTLLGDPYFRDALLQAGQLLVPQDDALPEHIVRIRRFAGADQPGLRRVLSTLEGSTAEQHQGSVVVVDGQGREVERIEGYFLSILLRYPDRPRMEDILSPHAHDQARLASLLAKAGQALEMPPLKLALFPERLEGLDKEARHAREAELVETLTPGNTLYWQEDGRPLLADGQGISLSHDATHCLVALGPLEVGCDLEPVTARDWGSLLPPSLRTLLAPLRAGGDGEDAAGARLWAVSEALRKVGVEAPQALITGRSQARAELEVDVSGRRWQVLSWVVPFARGPRRALALVWPLGDALPSPIDPESHRLQLRRGVPDRMETRFVVPFDDASSVSGHVPVHALASWMGRLRELALAGLKGPLLQALDSGRYGMVTQSAWATLEGEASALDRIEAHTWVESLHPASCLLCFAFTRLTADGRQEPVGQAAQRFGWVEVLGHGQVRGAPIPAFLFRFLSSLQADSTHPDLAPLGVPTTPALSRGSFPTSQLESNVVGNLYYAHYFRWPQRVLDQLLWQKAPGIFGQRGRQGELQVRQVRLEFLREAMPFDTVEVSIHPRASGEKLSWDVLFQRLELDGSRTRLALGELSARYIQRSLEGKALEAEPPAFLLS